jgi:hypothetical protein
MNKVIPIIIVAFALGGCSSWNDKHGKGDSPVGKTDDSPARVVNMPDGFANLAIKCYNGNGIYVTTRDAAPTIIVNDPNCPQKAR